MDNAPITRQQGSHLSPEATAHIRSRLPIGFSGWLVRGLPAWEVPGFADCEVVPILLAITDQMQKTAGGAKEHPDLPAGYTYFGQFMAHDLSFDPATVGQRQTDPDRLHSYRSPLLDLDSVYGGGPFAEDWLYQKDNKSLAVYPSDQGLPRTRTGKALIPDGRNDENIVVSHLHYAITLLHNMLAKDEGFESARRHVQWHYQWVILYDYLKRILHPDVYQRLLDVVDNPRPEVTQLRYYRPTLCPYVPVEFSAAAFRFGHSLLREEYELNPSLTRDLEGQLVPLLLLDGESSKLDNVPGTFSVADTGQPEGWYIHWPFFLDFGDGRCQRAMRIDTHLNARLFKTLSDQRRGQEPAAPGDRRLTAGGSRERVSLAFLDLLAGVTYGLPSGQTLARALGLSEGKKEILSPDQIGLSPVNRKLRLREGAGLERETPLWYYVLREAEVQTGGKTLGRLGSEIVGETILGLLLEDKFSFLTLDPRWTPDLGKNGTFELKDLVAAAL